jgi:hypothetical protein
MLHRIDFPHRMLLSLPSITVLTAVSFISVRYPFSPLRPRDIDIIISLLPFQH